MTGKWSEYTMTGVGDDSDEGEVEFLGVNTELEEV